MVKEREATGRGSGIASLDAPPTPRREARTVDRRTLIPREGLREYWYPALEARLVRKKPVGLKMLGEQLVFFPDKNNEVRALWNVCPHRGGSLMHGDCHFKGTISCPYHGWTFDGDGNVLGVLPEGPESKVPGKVQARAFPTRTLRGMVFVWMGEREPAPIEEDVPPEFFREDGVMRFAKEVWPVNWRQAVENAGDAHVPYVHRDAMFTLMVPSPLTGPRVSGTVAVNGRAVKSPLGPGGGRQQRNTPYRASFPALGPNAKWPKHNWRRLWAWAFAWGGKRRRQRPPMDTTEEWGLIGGSMHHLPAMVRLDYRTHVFTRCNIPIDADTTRQIYYHFTDAKNPLGKLYEVFIFHVFHRWAHFSNFSVQDFLALAPQRYDTPEYLSATDSRLVMTRRLFTRARGLEHLRAGEILPTTPAEDASRKLQIELGMKPEWEPGDVDK